MRSLFSQHFLFNIHLKLIVVLNLEFYFSLHLYLFLFCSFSYLSRDEMMYVFKEITFSIKKETEKLLKNVFIQQHDTDDSVQTSTILFELSAVLPFYTDSVQCIDLIKSIEVSLVKEHVNSIRQTMNLVEKQMLIFS
jgi:hypothetical protein